MHDTSKRHATPDMIGDPHDDFPELPGILGFASRADMNPHARELTARGVPEQWQPYCRTASADEPPSEFDLSVGGSAPARSVAELSAAVEMGLGLDVFLEDGADLSRLAPIIGRVVRLSLHSRSGRATGWDVLRSAASLCSLHVGFEAKGGMPIDGLSTVTRFGGEGKSAVAGLALPGVVSLELDGGVPIEYGAVIEGPVRNLEMRRPSSVRALPAFGHPEELRRVFIVGAKHLDVSSLSTAVNLRDVTIARCDTVVGVEALRDLTGLETVVFENVRNLPGWQALQHVKVNAGRAFGVDAIGEQFVEAARVTSGSTWVVSPRTSRQRPASSVSSTAVGDGALVRRRYDQ